MTTDEPRHLPAARIVPLDDPDPASEAALRVLQAAIERTAPVLAEIMWHLHETGEAFIQIQEIVPTLTWIADDEATMLINGPSERPSRDSSSPDTTKPYPLDELLGRIDDLTG